MTAEIINLRKARKAKQRREATSSRRREPRQVRPRQVGTRGDRAPSGTLKRGAGPHAASAATTSLTSDGRRRRTREQRNTRPLKRSFAIKGHRTSISMEAPFWEALQQAAALENNTLAALVARSTRGAATPACRAPCACGFSTISANGRCRAAR